MSRVPSKADPDCTADYCPGCKGVLTTNIVSDEDVQKVCLNGDCYLNENFDSTDTPSMKMDGVDHLISALSAIAFTREKDPVVLKKMARDALGNIPVGVAAIERVRSAGIQVISGIDALLDDDQTITLRKQDGEFLAHIKRNGKVLWTMDKDSWMLCVLGVALAWASDGDPL
jgi:hypothetical protein